MSKKLTTEEFIERAMKVHNDKYDYSKVNYKKSNVKIIIICPIHGDFEQIPNNHLSGTGCPKCANEKTSMKLTLTTEQFIKKANDVHNNFYDYSEVNYKSAHKKIIIICPKHSEFEQTPGNHLNGQGCPKCANERKKSSTEQFIKKATEVHNDKYDYSKVEYIHSKKPIIAICSIHGEFEQIPNNHLRGNGCPKCSIEDRK